MQSLVLAGLFGLASAFALVEDAPKPVGALAPLPIDSAFEKARTPKELDEALLNDVQYAKAIKAALAAKKKREDELRKNPRILGASPAQAARVAFLEVLVAHAEPVGNPGK